METQGISMEAATSIFTTGKAPESADSHQVLQDVVSLPANSGFDLWIKVSFAAPWT